MCMQLCLLLLKTPFVRNYLPILIISLHALHADVVRSVLLWPATFREKEGIFPIVSFFCVIDSSFFCANPEKIFAVALLRLLMFYASIHYITIHRQLLNFQPSVVPALNCFVSFTGTTKQQHIAYQHVDNSCGR